MHDENLLAPAMRVSAPNNAAGRDRTRNDRGTSARANGYVATDADYDDCSPSRKVARGATNIGASVPPVTFRDETAG